MSLVLPLLAVLVPLLIAPGILFHYDSAPSIIVLCLAIAAVTVRPRALANTIDVLRREKAGRCLLVLAGLEIVWSIVAGATSTRPAFSFLGSSWRRFGVMTLLPLMMLVVLAAGHFIRHPEKIRSLLRVMAVVTIVGSLYGIAQYFDIDPLQSVAAYHAMDGDATIVRPPGTLGHADYFGWWLAVSLFGSLAAASLEKRLWRVTGFVSAALCGIAILLSGTRAAMLAAAIGLVCLAGVSRFRPVAKHLIGAVLILVALTAFVVSSAGERVRARVRWSADESFGGARPLLWRDSLRMATVHPLTGFGPEAFAAEFPKYQSVELARLLPDFYHESPHSTVLDALIGEGVPGLVILLGWAMVCGYVARLCLSRNAAPGVFLISGLAASAAASLFNVPTMGPVFASLILFAMLVALSVDDADQTGPSLAERLRWPLLLSPAVALCLAIFGVALTNYEFQLERFQKISAGGSSERAEEAYQSVLDASLPGAGEDVYSSRRLAALCGSAAKPVSGILCLQAATRAAVRGVSTSDNPPNAWYNLAMFTAVINDAPNTENALRTAVVLAPNWFKPHWTLSNLLFVRGRNSEALSEAERAVLLDANKNPEVSASLQKIAARR